MRDRFPNLSTYRPQRVWLPAPPGGVRRPKRKPRKLSGRRAREAAAVQRLAPGASRVAVIFMGIVLAAVTVLLVVIVAIRL